MNRREMLQESVKQLAGFAPRLLGVAGGLGQLLMREEKPRVETAACFPAGPSEVETGEPSPSLAEGESQ